MYGILAHFLHGSNSEGRRLKSLRDESLSQLHSRGMSTLVNKPHLKISHNPSIEAQDLEN